MAIVICLPSLCFILTPKLFIMLHLNQSTSFVPSLYIKGLPLLEYAGFNYQTKMAQKLKVE